MTDPIVFILRELIRHSPFNVMFSRLFSGRYEQKMATWTTTTRPTAPEPYRTFGMNLDYKSVELYMGPVTATPTVGAGWLIISGIWSSNPDAVANSLAVGSRGYNTDEDAFVGYAGVEEGWVYLG